MPKNRLFHQKRIKNNVILMRLPWGLGRFTLGFLF
jgi:hypothetical protein